MKKNSSEISYFQIKLIFTLSIKNQKANSKLIVLTTKLQNKQSKATYSFRLQGKRMEEGRHYLVQQLSHQLPQLTISSVGQFLQFIVILVICRWKLNHQIVY
jgi:hypothetical protein